MRHGEGLVDIALGNLGGCGKRLVDADRLNEVKVGAGKGAGLGEVRGTVERGKGGVNGRW